jgi:RNA polymerase sigma factor (sigma-70 family)
MKQDSSRTSTAAVLASYAAFLGTELGPHENRKQLIDVIVRDCDTRYRWGVYAMIRRMNLGHEDAEDILQDILFRWTRQLESGGKLPAPEALTTWFRKVGRHAAIDYLRRVRGKWREAECESGARRLAAAQRTPLFDLAAKELPKVIDRILRDNITPEMRRVFELRQQRLTYPEIADKSKGRSAEAVRSVMRKVLGILREELERLGWSIP